MENLSPQIIKKITKELQEIVADPPEGIRLKINEADILDIQATIDGPADTPYEGGVFCVRLSLGKEFPEVPPKAFFTTKIFHPNVSAKGEICVNTLKRDWSPSHGIKHILLTIKCLLIVPNPESALNDEAGMMLLDHYDNYYKRAKLITEIHAMSSKASSKGTIRASKSEMPPAKKYVTQGGMSSPSHMQDKPKPKDKKRLLKRL